MGITKTIHYTIFVREKAHEAFDKTLQIDQKHARIQAKRDLVLSLLITGYGSIQPTSSVNTSTNPSWLKNVLYLLKKKEIQFFLLL